MSTGAEKAGERPNRARRNDEDSRFKANMRPKDLQKSQIEKLMLEPDKPMEIPEKNEDWKPPEPPEFKRFYMGSSAGAGSEVFHVYRHLRRYEMIRQQWINDTAEKEDKDVEFQQRLAEKKAAAEEKTAKKRAKRLKKKQKIKERKTVSTTETSTNKEEQQNNDDEDDEDDNDEDTYDNPFVIGGK